MLRRRMEAVVFLQVPVDVSPTEAFLVDERQAGRRITRFQVLLAAMVRTLHDRPHLNRFVKGGRLWQRDHVALTFAVKRRFDDCSRIVSTQVRFEADDDLDDVVDRIARATDRSRTSARPRSETLPNRLARLPGPLRRAILATHDRLDHLGVLPARLLATSPLHTSAMVSNLGSLGLDSALHHLYEPGTCSINLTMGKVRQRPVVLDDGTVAARPVLRLGFAYDERICDGYYAARTIEQLTDHLRDPAGLRR